MIPLEILMVLILVGIFAAIIWTIFDHRDLRVKYTDYVEEVAKEFARLKLEIDKLKQRTGV